MHIKVEVCIAANTQLMYDILPVYFRGVARVHLGESATKYVVWDFPVIVSRDDLAPGPTPRNLCTTTVSPSHSVVCFTQCVMPGRRETKSQKCTSV